MTAFSRHFNPSGLLPRPPECTKACLTQRNVPMPISLENDLAFCGLSSCASPR